MTTYHVVTEASEDDGREVFGVYDAVFGDQPDQTAWRTGVWDRHAAREGFRLARAHDGARLVGFAYGYTGRRGQWWTEQAVTVLGPDVAQEWLGGHFELVSLGVLPVARRRGIARGLMHLLLREVPHDRMLLMTTADEADPARRLYAAHGWTVLGAGISPATVVLGKLNPAAGGP